MEIKLQLYRPEDAAGKKRQVLDARCDRAMEFYAIFGQASGV